MFMFLLSIFPAQAAVVINEFLPNPDGVDGGSEWIELHNTGSSAIDLQGWVIEAGTSVFSPKFTFGAVSLGPGGFLVVGEELVVADVVLGVGERLALGNAGSSGDGVRLVNGSGMVIDTVIYGPDNSDGFLDDTGSSPSSVVSVAGSGRSLARIPDGTDTDTAADFSVQAMPTPGEANETSVVYTCDLAGSGVKINELLFDPAGADTGAEWVEVIATGGTVDLSGWEIKAGTSSYSTGSVLPQGTLLGSGQILLIGQSESSNPDVVAAGFVLGNASNADAVQLLDCEGTLADTVVYGTDNSDGWVDDVGNLAALAPRAPSGQSLARLPDGADTDDASVDFSASFPSPGLSNLVEASDCGGLGAGLVVNEFLTNPVGADDGHEWVELFHAGESPIDLDGWVLESSTGSSWGARHTFAPQVLSPGERLLLGGAQISGRTHDLLGSLGNGTGGDGLRIVDCGGFASDTVVYGADNEDGLRDDSGEIALSLAPVPLEGGSVQRVEDGYDSDQSGLDFVIASEPTPGAPNLIFAPPPCASDEGMVRINEVLPDPEGTDTGLEWIELFNLGADPVTLDGWSLSAGTTDYNELDVTFPAGSVIPPGGFFVVGGELVAEADGVSTTLSIGNGSSSRDGIRLFDCEGNPVDTVVYGALEEEPVDPGIVDDNDELAESYGDPGSQISLFRTVDGVDTDTAADWSVGRPTPGATNVITAPQPWEQEGPGGCGAGGPRDLDPLVGEPTGEAPSSTGCSSLSFPLGSFGLVGVLLIRRRHAHR